MESDSETDITNSEHGINKNVTDFASVPEDFHGKIQKGHLIFDANFESGNLGKVVYISDFEYDIFIRPDSCNNKYRVWFNFIVKNVCRDQRAIFNIVNCSKTKSLYRDGMSPVVKSTSRNQWVRIRSNQVYYYRSPRYNYHYVMAFIFAFDIEEDYQFAYCFPYTYSQLQTFLYNLDLKGLPYYKRELLCLSTQQRRVDVLTITNEKNIGNSNNCKIVVITARVHPGETPASYVCEGLIKFLIKNTIESENLREHIIFKIVPMLNPDGVYLGNYRCCLMGFDLNRHWSNPSPWAHPTICATKNLLINLTHSPVNNVEFYIDIHAHSTMKNGFMYGNIFDDVTRANRQAILPQLLSNNTEDFSMSNTSFNKDEIKAGTSRRIFGGVLDEYAYCYTLEVSFFSYLPKSDGVASNATKMQLYNEFSYMKLGENVGKTLIDYYKQNGLIAVNVN
ncbi:Cytosolic carboxypeptidase 6 [Intoshia linei]|uniref:Cytosolic carboxypeptidase 6 n=1 Tax=Intoshia linei TaxID=1819745 RepID=A0A177BD25_9BILA|nr:Cytosolic carboxypeptidase 6 [Intoshia linei]